MSPVWHDLPERELGSYSRSPSFGGRTMVARLLWITVGVWGLCVLLAALPPTRGFARTLLEVGSLNPALWVEWAPLAPLWQLLTYGFLHALQSPTHILFNALGLFFFGRMVEEAVGARRFLYLWLAAIAVGGAAQLGWSFALGERFPTIGASGAVMAVVCAAAVLQPHTTVIFFVFPLKLRTFALLYVGLDLFQLLQGQGGTAYVVHLSGAALGFLAARRGWMWSDPLARMRERRQARTQRVRTAERERDEARLDRLLAQINEGGLASLSEADREFLRRVSATRREQTRDQGL